LPAFLEERREVAQERVCGEAVGGGLLLLLGRQVVGDVEERLKKGDVEEGEQDERGECAGLQLGVGGTHCIAIDSVAFADDI